MQTAILQMLPPLPAENIYADYTDEELDTVVHQGYTRRELIDSMEALLNCHTHSKRIRVDSDNKAKITMSRNLKKLPVESDCTPEQTRFREKFMEVAGDFLNGQDNGSAGSVDYVVLKYIEEAFPFIRAEINDRGNPGIRMAADNGKPVDKDMAIELLAWLMTCFRMTSVRGSTTITDVVNLLHDKTRMTQYK